MKGRPAAFQSNPVAPPEGIPPRRRAGWMRRLYLTLRTEHTTPGKVAAAVGVGVFVGCSPFWGLHTAIVLVVATAFKLNRVLVYAATNLANPITAPPLIFAEVQVGHRILRGVWLGLSIDEVYDLGFGGIFLDFLIGSLIVGGSLAVLLGALAWFVSRAGQLPSGYQDLVDSLVRRYLDGSIRDAERARWRLTRDRLFPLLLDDPGCAAATRILDLGCGRGLAGAILATAPAGTALDRSYLGVDLSARYIRVAREVLGDVPGLEFRSLDLRDFDPPPADVVLLIDVLRYLPSSSQDALLRRLGKALAPGARVLVRDVDASSGAGYRVAMLVDLLLLLLPGRPRHTFHYRRAADLANALAVSGFEVRDRSTPDSAGRGRVLLEAVRRPAAVPRS